MRKYRYINSFILATVIVIFTQFTQPSKIQGDFVYRENNMLNSENLISEEKLDIRQELTIIPSCIESKIDTIENKVDAMEANLTENQSSNLEEQKTKKEVFLTFDDGPCINNTRKILKILRDNNVPATFFVVGRKGEENPQILRELSDSGMSIGIHTYCHEYRKIYKNTDEYFKDYEACRNTIKKITGKEPTSYIRMPGGSDNLVTSKRNLESIKSELNNRGIKYVDWNVSAGDAESHDISSDKIYRNIMWQCKEKRMAVVLMHDTYYNNVTVEALPSIIKYLKKEGFVFRTFDYVTANEESKMVNIGVVNRG